MMPRGFTDASHWSPTLPEPQAGSSPTALFPSTGPHGHRKRMRERLLSRGGATIADYEILEMLLFYGIPRKDTKPLAKATINRFGSLAAVLRANRATLLAAPEITPRCAEAISLVQETCPCMTAAEAREAPILSNWASLRAYLATTSPKPLRILYLDNKNRLLADEPAPSPVLDAPTTRTILTRALELHSVSLMLAAWRADTITSRADRENLLRLRAAATSVSVGIHDLVLVAGGEVVSVQQDL